MEYTLTLADLVEGRRIEFKLKTEKVWQRGYVAAKNREGLVIEVRRLLNRNDQLRVVMLPFRFKWNEVEQLEFRRPNDGPLRASE